MWKTTVSCSRPSCEHRDIEVPQQGALPHEDWIAVRRRVIKLNPQGKAPRKQEIMEVYCSLRCLLLFLGGFEQSIEVKDLADPAD
jgi:hypothetical protein